jgi:hypothetical protein
MRYSTCQEWGRSPKVLILCQKNLANHLLGGYDFKRKTGTEAKKLGERLNRETKKCVGESASSRSETQEFFGHCQGE